MTETNMNTSNPYDGERHAGTVGFPLPGVELKICDETGKELPQGEIGTLEVRGPNVFKGYWQKSGGPRDERRGEWFPTGDIGMIDEDGFLHYLGRKKDMLKVKGMSVFPSEVETLLGQHPAIDASGVLGRDDADFNRPVAQRLS